MRNSYEDCHAGLEDSMVHNSMAVQLALVVLLIAPIVSGEPGEPDWLVTAVRTPAAVERDKDGRELALSNGLIRRTFRLQPNGATRQAGGHC
jgi:hypothetical protein